MEMKITRIPRLILKVEKGNGRRGWHLVRRSDGGSRSGFEIATPMNHRQSASQQQRSNFGVSLT